MRLRPFQRKFPLFSGATLGLLLAVRSASLAQMQEPPSPADLVRSQQKIDSRLIATARTPGEVSGFGFSIEAIGDFDGNRVPDLAVGVHFDDILAEDTGAVCLLLLRRDGSVERVHKIHAASGGFAGPLGVDDVFGWSIAALGDLDGNGVVDLAVGAPGDDDGGPDVGAVYILFLRADGSVLRQQKISAREPWARRRPWTWFIPRSSQGSFFAAVEPYENFGVAVDAIGDLDGDGVVDLAVGARTGGDTDRLRGAVWILFLERDGTVKAYRRLDVRTPALREALHEKDEFGFGLASLGDLDGDGLAELAVGARGDDDGGLDQGAVYVLYLDSTGEIRHLRKLSSRSGNFSGKLNASSEFGLSIAAVPDLSGDGLRELLVGSRGDAERGQAAGAAWLLSLASDGQVQHSRKITAGMQGFTGPLQSWDRFGAGLATVGDLDGDGTPELVIGAEGDDEHGTDGGALWVLFLQPQASEH